MKGFKNGYVNKETLECTFMESKCEPKEKLKGYLVPIPKFQFSYKERESLGNGWYGNIETKHSSCSNAYLVIIDNKCIGFTHVYPTDRKIILKKDWLSKEMENYKDNFNHTN